MVAHGRVDVLKSGNNLLVSTDSLNRAYQSAGRAVLEKLLDEQFNRG
ncbi:hypothetical protein ACX80V_08610 [Arthrobacter sp. MDT3-24]